MRQGICEWCNGRGKHLAPRPTRLSSTLLTQLHSCKRIETHCRISSTQYPRCAVRWSLLVAERTSGGRAFESPGGNAPRWSTLQLLYGVQDSSYVSAYSPCDSVTCTLLATDVGAFGTNKASRSVLQSSAAHTALWRRRGHGPLYPTLNSRVLLVPKAGR